MADFLFQIVLWIFGILFVICGLFFFIKIFIMIFFPKLYALLFSDC